MNTPNYGLHLTDDASERFLDWRNHMNGPNDSNMTKIDTALAEKAEHSTIVQGVLSSSGWSGNVQVLTVEGLAEDQNGTLALAQSATMEQRDAVRSAMLSITAQSAGSLTITADGDVPTVDIPVAILLLD